DQLCVHPARYNRAVGWDGDVDVEFGNHPAQRHVFDCPGRVADELTYPGCERAHLQHDVHDRRSLHVPLHPASDVDDGLGDGGALGRGSRERGAVKTREVPLPAPGSPLPQVETIFPIGNLRIRFPVAAKIALHTAGAIGGTPGSTATSWG